MIDIHTHILPGMDDGAVDILDTIEMARLAAMSGVTEIVQHRILIFRDCMIMHLESIM